jgi:hypothetical protein
MNRILKKPVPAPERGRRQNATPTPDLFRGTVPVSRYAITDAQGIGADTHSRQQNEHRPLTANTKRRGQQRQRPYVLIQHGILDFW